MPRLPLRLQWVWPTFAGLALGAGSLGATPITGAIVPSNEAAVAPIRVTEQALLGDDPAVEPIAEAAAARRAQPGHSPAGDRVAELSDPGGLGLVDLLRPAVSIAPAGARPRSPQRPGTRAGDPVDEMDLGPEAREWMQSAFRGIVNSVVELDVDDRGRTSFSLLGMGEFGIAVSGDRGRIALISGDHVLMTAQRTADAAVAPLHSGAAGHTVPAGGWTPGASAGASNVDPWQNQSPLRKALELVLEIAGHPISLLVYLLIAGYIVLWNVLGREARGGARALAHSPASHVASGSRPSGRGRRRRHRMRRRHRRL